MTLNQKQTKGKKKMGPIILGIVAVIIVIAIIAVSNIGGNNVKAMNDAVDTVLTKLNENFTVTPVDVGDYKEMKIYGIMKFDVEQYEIEEIGNLSIMRMNALGLMQMSTLVITPKDKNLPLLSTDYMYILSNRKSYVEIYDLSAKKDEAYNQLLTNLSDALKKYNHLEDVATSETWYSDLLGASAYKAGKSADDADMKSMLTDTIDVYIAHAKQLPLLTEEEKAEKLAITLEYTNGLVEKGGVSTDVFKKELGEEETKKFFDNIFFGTAK
ncbi:MAG: hypothetical protein IJ455_09165 [Agathobacter sp.]|nr:hypothetical protein [Agathobacter sp.]